MIQKNHLHDLFSMADAMQKSIGAYCEVIIYDTTQPEYPAIYLAGNVTNSSIGTPCTDLIMQTLQKGGEPEDIHGHTNTTRDGKTLRTSIVFVRNDEKIITGCMCINFDLTPILTWKHFLERSIPVSTPETHEPFAMNMNDAMTRVITSVVEQYHTPVSNLPKEDKLVIVQNLDEKGVFLMKGAIELVAATLGVSRYSVYNYIDEVRNTKALSKALSITPT